jgi:23S rRNA A1618 N6-methylase RlmF
MDFVGIFGRDDGYKYLICNRPLHQTIKETVRVTQRLLPEKMYSYSHSLGSFDVMSI